MDFIGLKDLELSCVIGVGDEERRAPSCIHANIGLTVDTSKSGRSDLLCDTVDYAALEQELFKTAEGSRFRLLEALAESLAEKCLLFSGVSSVEVELEKRGILRHTRAAVVRIRRDNTKTTSIKG